MIGYRSKTCLSNCYWALRRRTHCLDQIHGNFPQYKSLHPPILSHQTSNIRRQPIYPIQGNRYRMALAYYFFNFRFLNCAKWDPIPSLRYHTYAIQQLSSEGSLRLFSKSLYRIPWLATIYLWDWFILIAIGRITAHLANFFYQHRTPQELESRISGK